MAATYQELLVEASPKVIQTEAHYDIVVDRLAELVGKGVKRTSSETELMRLLALLVEDYDQRNAAPFDKATPAELLQFLVEHSGQSAAALLTPIFGQRSHVYEALHGKRGISALQARKLGELFHLKPGLFI